jgi:hypothetical protein
MGGMMLAMRVMSVSPATQFSPWGWINTIFFLAISIASFSMVYKVDKEFFVPDSISI